MNYDNQATFLSEEWWQNATVDDVEAEIAKGADVDAEDKLGRMPLMYAVVHNCQPDVIEALINNDADVNAACEEDGMTVLMYASWFNLPEMIEILVKHGADIEAHDYLGATVFDYANDNGCEEALDKLTELSSTPLPHFFNEEWWQTATPDDVAMEFAGGADVNAVDEWSHFPLIYAVVFCDNPETLNALLSAGADVNAVCRADGMTALMYAVWQNTNPMICKVLLDWGADIEAKDNEGNTVFDYAQENQNPDVMTILTEYPQYS